MLARKYKVIISEETFDKLVKYKAKLASQSIHDAGMLLQAVLANDMYAKNASDFSTYIKALTIDEFLDLINRTRQYKLLAESQLNLNPSQLDWNNDEGSILGDVNFVFEDATVYNNGGRKFAPDNTRVRVNHPAPIQATILYANGALLASATAKNTPDIEELIDQEDRTINKGSYFSFIERHLLPILLFANDHAAQDGKKALITLQGLGLGAFAGKYQKQLEELFPTALNFLLLKHIHHLPNIAALRVDLYKGENRDEKLKHIDLIYRPTSKPENADKQLLQKPEDYNEENKFDFTGCKLFTIVNGDPYSYIGNEFNEHPRYSESTNDSAIISATDAPTLFSGVPGDYDAAQQYYYPKVNVKNAPWGRVYEARKIQVESAGRTYVTNNKTGERYKLEGDFLNEIDTLSQSNPEPADIAPVPQPEKNWFQRNETRILWGLLFVSSVLLGTAGLVLTFTGFGAPIGIPAGFIATLLGIKAGALGTAASIGVCAAPAVVVGTGIGIKEGFFTRIGKRISNFFSSSSTTQEKESLIPEPQVNESKTQNQTGKVFQNLGVGKDGKQEKTQDSEKTSQNNAGKAFFDVTPATYEVSEVNHVPIQGLSVKWIDLKFKAEVSKQAYDNLVGQLQENGFKVLRPGDYASIKIAAVKSTNEGLLDQSQIEKLIALIKQSKIRISNEIETNLYALNGIQRSPRP